MKIKPKLKAALIPIVCCSILAASFTVFTVQLNKDVFISVNQEIIENERRTSTSMTAKLNEKLAVLSSLSSFIGGRDLQSDKSVLDTMHSFSKNGAFVLTFVADQNGDGITDTGVKSNVAGYHFFKKSNNGNKWSVFRRFSLVWKRKPAFFCSGFIGINRFRGPAGCHRQQPGAVHP